MMYEMTLDEAKKALEAAGEKGFRAEQIYDWLFVKGAQNFHEMTNLSKEMREKLTALFPASPLSFVKREESEDGETTKFLFALHDKKYIEAVLIRSPERQTVCVSCQVGCPARCAFCASGKEGLLRNLSPGEIVQQVVYIDALLQKEGKKVTNIVFMGMGEPLANYDAVVKAIKIFHEPKGFNFSLRRITISTVGVVEGIERLMKEELKVNLVLSLHAPNQELRKKIIPFARKYELFDILRAMRSYAKATKRDVTYEYTLLSGINDEREHAQELAVLLEKEQCTVNLIPYNPVPGRLFERPKEGAIHTFRAILEERGIRVTWRYTKGKDIQAACGQLALIGEQG